MAEIPAFHPFELERMLSKIENTVDYNLSESGAHPLSLRQLLAMTPSGGQAMLEELLDTEFYYPQTNGILPLREQIAAQINQLQAKISKETAVDAAETAESAGTNSEQGA